MTEAVIVRGADGRFQAGTRAPATITTSAHARSLAEKRWAKTRQAVREAVLAEVGPVANVTTPIDAYAWIASKQAVALADSDKPRMDDLDKLGQIMGLRRDATERQAGDTYNTVNAYSLPPALLALLRERDVVEGAVIGGDEGGPVDGGG